MARTKTRRRAHHGAITKAINPGLMQGFQQAPQGNQPVRFGLMDLINASTQTRAAGFWDYRPMPRDPRDDNTFGPGHPLTPEPVDQPNRDGSVAPRLWEYPMSWNLPGNQKREVPWQVLREASVGVDIIRRCIEGRKKHVRTLQWAFAVSSDVVEEAYAADPGKGRDNTAGELREKYAAEIKRLTAFWKHPWCNAPGGGWDFGQWVNALMEEYLVLDAVSIYPRKTYGGDLFALEQVDGSTIKPLLDYRGAMPLPPHPAYQQLLYGFPRGEWQATAKYDDEGKLYVPDGYSASELFYHRENARVHSPYGLSAVEQALISARLYIKRQGWLLAEYDDGSTPLTVFVPPADPSLTGEFKPAQRREWEDAINAELGGQTKARHRMKVAPPGWEPHQLNTVDQQYRPEFDLFLIKLLAGHFGMTATELGFSETQGLGSSGFAENQSEVAGRVGLKPDVQVLAGIINRLSRAYLNAPEELEFSFIDPASENDAESDGVADAQLKRGAIVLNDDRRRLKLPLYDFPEADMPMLVGAGPSGVIFLEGAKAAADAAAEAAVKQQEATAEGAKGKLEVEHRKIDEDAKARKEDRDFQRETRDSEQEFAREQAETTTKAVTSELQAFATWRKRNPDPKRPFVFKAATPDDFTDHVPGPTVCDFGDEWEWLEDIDKYESWWPRDSRGRWVKRSHLTAAVKAGRSLVDVLKEDQERHGSGVQVDLLTRAGFDALPDDQREAVLAELRQVRDTGRQVSYTVPSNRTSMGTTIRGTKDAPEVEAARAKLRELTEVKPEPIDNSTAGRARRAAAGQPYAIDGTMAQLQEIADANGWGYVGAWKRDKAVDYLRNHAIAHDVLPERWDTPGVAEAMRGADSRKALALLDIQDANGRMSLADLDAIAAHLGVPKPTGRDKRAKMHDLAGKAKAAGAPPVTAEEPEVPKATEFDLLLTPDSPHRIKNKNMAKLVEQMEAHGWKLSRQDGPRALTEWEAPDGRTLQVQFISGDKPTIYHPGRHGVKMTYRAATAHVVTPTLPDHAPSARIEEAMSNLGLTPIPPMYRMEGARDPWQDPLRHAQQGLHPVGSYGGRGETAQQAAAGLRTSAERYREAARTADKLYGYGGARDANSVRREELADQFDRIADELERMDAAYVASVAERQRLEALPLDIRPARARKAGDLTKAGEPDPKAEAPADERWPGWAQDLAIAAGVSVALSAALAAGAASLLSVRALANLFADWAQGWQASDPRPDTLTRLKASTDLGPQIERDIRQPIEDAWLEGYFVGTRSAGALVDNAAAGLNPRDAVSVDVDWAGWTPGDISAARRIMTEDGSIQPWLDLLRDAGITIKRIADNRLQEVARCLADGLDRGASVDEIARDLQRTINDPAWCYKVAVTETNRAMSAATLDTYQYAGVAASEWLDANDARVCKICRANAAAGPVRLGERYPSGDYHPPAHPHDRCALVPALLDDLLKAAMPTHRIASLVGQDFYTLDLEESLG